MWTCYSNKLCQTNLGLFNECNSVLDFWLGLLVAAYVRETYFNLNSITVYPLSPIVTLHCLEAIIERRKSVCSLHYLLEAVLGRLRLPCIAFRGHSIVTPPLQSVKRKLFFTQTGEILTNNSFCRAVERTVSAIETDKGPMTGEHI